MGTINNEKVEKKTMILGNTALPNETTNYCVSSPPTHFLNLLLDDTLLIIIQKFKALRVTGSGEGAADAMSGP